MPVINSSIIKKLKLLLTRVEYALKFLMSCQIIDADLYVKIDDLGDELALLINVYNKKNTNTVAAAKELLIKNRANPSLRMIAKETISDVENIIAQNEEIFEEEDARNK